MHRVLIDYENVHPDFSLLATIPSIDITVFVGVQQRLLPQHRELLSPLGSCARTLKVHVAGRNSLDMHLVFYLSSIIEAYPLDSFEIISNDKDYDSIISTLRSRNINICRSPFVRLNPI